MADDENTVGSMALPLDAGTLNDGIDDPTITGLLAYLAHWIKEALDARLAMLEGPTTAGAITDACPVAHRFAFDHGGSFMRPLPDTGTAPLPGLWAWERSATWRQETMYWSAVERTIVVHYIFPELVTPSGPGRRNGLMSAAMRAIATGIERGRHPSFSLDGGPAGVPLFRSLGLQSIDLASATPGRLEVIPGGAATGTGRTNTSGTVHRFYPTLEVVLTVVERIGANDAEGPDQADAAFAFASGDDANDGLDVLERVATQDDSPDEG